ncbi:MAG: CDC27 family protein [Candidatus Berkiella sp.]
MHLIAISSLAILLLQVFCVVHAFHRGYPHGLIMMILLVPFAGALAYLVIEFGPEIYHSHRRIFKSAVKANPQHELQAKRMAANEIPTIENLHALARCYLQLNDFQSALAVLDSLLKNQFSHDPDLLLDKAKALFGLQKFNEAKFILETLLSEKKNQCSMYPQIHLLFARSLAALGEFQLANFEFERLQNYYSGLEASYYYLKHLRQHNHQDRAQEVLTAMRKRLNRLPKHFQSTEQAWLKQAQKE